VLFVVLLYAAGAQCRFNDAVKPATHSKSSSLKSVVLKSKPSVGSDDVCSAEMLSNSSLRRKLFFHGDEGTPLSPVRCVMFYCLNCNMIAQSGKQYLPGLLFVERES